MWRTRKVLNIFGRTPKSSWWSESLGLALIGHDQTALFVFVFFASPAWNSSHQGDKPSDEHRQNDKEQIVRAGLDAVVSQVSGVSAKAGAERLTKVRNSVAAQVRSANVERAWFAS